MMERAWAVQEWQAGARVEETIWAILEILEARFGRVPADMAKAISAVTDLSRLRTWVRLTATATSLEEFRAAAGL